ncbi:MAG: CusA/CzcA family heavy metal efflux RND transporter [Gemmatimonadaceae bacterium]|jgi:copper/silver efflux system protein|nr:CusA/CzcA family heavy metal efflux RND transporter [Gemmatimonadaceae bacterium]
MLKFIIGWSVTHKLAVLLGTFLVTVAGVWALLTTPVDAIPDLSDAQVIVMTEWPGQAPQLVEDQVTYPLETELLKVPNIKFVRGMSQFGISAVYVVFEDGTDLYWARSRVLEYLNGVRDKLPEGAMPMLGPDATGVGWVMQYILADTTGTKSLADLRALQDFTVRPALTAVPGVAEIASFGGFEREYQVQVDPAKLLAFNVSMSKVADAVRASNQDVGGRVLEMGGTEYVVRGRGRFASLDDLRKVSIGTGEGGTPVTVNDVATVQTGPALRRGIADLNGMGEVVTGWVVMRYGANPREVIAGVKAKMAEVERALPPGVRFVEGYDRSGLIDRAVETLREKLVEESIIVAIVTVLFLLHAQSALVAIVTLPIGIVMALLAMKGLGLNANIMSLGGIAIAIGAMIDAAIVMVENLHKHMERNEAEGRPKDHWTLVVEAAQEVGPALFISLLIITASFLPVFALEDQEGRLFKPLAWTKTLAMAAAALLSITLVPVMMGLFIRKGVKPEAANPVNRFLVWAYRPVIEFVLRHRWPTIIAAGVMLAVTVFPWSKIGSEFMPPLNEGSIMDMPSLFPGVGTAQAKQILQQRDAALARIPEVQTVMGKIGRAESATDMAPMSMIETIAILKDKKDWRPGVTYDSIVSEANNTVKTPGVGNMWSMPIKNRLDMLATGIKTPVGIKVFGPSLDTLDQIGREIEGILPNVAGTNTVFAERAVGGRYLDVTVDRDAVARYGLTVDEVQMALSTAVGGMDAGQVIAGRERFGVLVRYPRELRDSPDRLREVLVATPSGAQIALGELARIDVVKGSTLIKSENALLNNVVYVDVQGRDIGSYVSDAKAVLQQQLTLPAGYRLQWSGQFESLERATKRLRVVVPITLVIIFGLLYFNFRNVVEVGIVMLSLPFALVGGVWLMWLLDYNMSVAVAIGFIALAGVAAETGVIMLIYLDHAYQDRAARDALHNRHDVDAAIEHGAVERVRPKMMTVTAIMAGLVPILWSQGTGADVMKRIAAPMVGGMLTSTVLTLVVIPAIYSLWKEREVRRAVRGPTAAPSSTVQRPVAPTPSEIAAAGAAP